MEIWIFNHYAVTPDTTGITRHYDLASELTKKGHRVTIFASSFNHPLRRDIKGKYKNYKGVKYCPEERNKVLFVWIKTVPSRRNNWGRVVNMLSYSINSYKLAKELNLPMPEAVIGSSPHLFAAYTAYRVAGNKKVPFVLEVRDLWAESLVDVGVPRFHPFIISLKLLEKFLYKKADRIITLLPYSHRHITREEKVVYIPNGVNLGFFNLRKKEKLHKGFLLIYSGTMNQSNNPESIIKAASILDRGYPNIKFIFLGDGFEKTKLIEMSKNLDNVVFMGPVPKKGIADVLRKVDVGIVTKSHMPVLKYGISYNKMFDYMAAAKPVIIASNYGNNPVKDANAGITVNPNEPEELASVAVKLYKMPDGQRKKMGQRGRAYVEKYHSTAMLADKLEGVLKEVVR